MIYANWGAIAVIASTACMTIMKLIDEYPLSPAMTMIVIDHDPNIYIE